MICSISPLLAYNSGGRRLDRRKKTPTAIALILAFVFACFSASDGAPELVTGRPPQFSFSQSVQVSVAEGEPLTLECPVLTSGFDVQWFKNDVPLTKFDSTLTVPLASKLDAGRYQCFASNGIGGSFSPDFNVTIVYMDGFSKKPDAFFKRTVTPRDYFVLPPPSLLSSAKVKVSWRWTFEGHNITINDTHYIANDGELVVLQTGNRFGLYQVEAHTSKKTVYSPKYLISNHDVMFAPEPEFTIVLRPKDLVVSAVDLSTTPSYFECVPSIFGRYPAEIKWLLNGSPIVIDGHLVRTEHGNRRLVITNAISLLGRNTSTGKIRCEATSADSHAIVHADASLDIVSPPKIDQKALPSEIAYKIGDSFKLNCKVTSHVRPRTKISWYFNSEKLPTSSEILRVENATADQFGVYQCRASNVAGSDTTQVWIKPDDGLIKARFDDSSSFDDNNSPGARLEIIDAPEDIAVIAGKDVVFQCRTKDPHNTQLLWSINGTEIPRTNPRFTTNSTTLTVHGARHDDAGVYTCLASNAEGLTAEASSTLAVSGSKLIEYGPSNQSILIGSNVHIPCKLNEDFAGKSDLWTTWSRNGIEIPVNGDAMRRISFNGENLMINQVGPDNIGLYTCTVKSSDGVEESASGWLKIIEKPSMPQNVHVLLVNDTIPAKIKVLWRPGFDGNSPIIKYLIELRTIGPTGLWSEWETVVENIPSEMCCSSMVDNIRPSSTAEFRVIAFNRFGAGKPSRSSESITMPQQPPAAAPRNVAASARSSSSVMVQWQPPPPDQWNGDILGYHVRYRLSGYATAGWNEKNISNGHARNALIEPLITWREYEIQVAAYNDRGLGVYSKPIEVTTLEGVPMQPPQNVNIDVLNSTAIRVAFDPPDQQMIPGVNLGYKIELWKGPPQSGTPYRSIRVYPELTRIEEIIGNLEKFGHYNVTTVCFTSPGDGPLSDAVEVVTDEDVPGPIVNVNFDQVMSNSVVVQWEKPSEPNGVLLKYVIRYWEDQNPSEKRTLEVNAGDIEATIEGLVPSTKYSIDIQAVTKVGSGQRTEAKFESGVPPELPGKPSSLAVSDIGPRSVVLQFVPGFDGHSFIKRWHVEACIGASTIFTQIFNVSAPKARSFTVEGLRPYTKYKLRLIAENVRGRGAPSEPTRGFQTRQTDPENPPDKVFAEPVSDNQISLAWTPLMSSHWNGDSSGYLIQYRAANAGNEDDDSAESLSDLVEWKEIRTSNPKASELMLTDLRPYTSYQVKIFAENTFGRSAPSETVFATTYESVPGAAPLNVKAELDRTKRAVTVTWDDVEDKYKNGAIAGYTVKIVPDEARLRHAYSRQVEIIGGDQHLAKIDNLRPFTEYRVFVVAFTIVGEGPQNSDPPLVITSEDIPDEPTGLAFGYVSSSEVRLKWMPPLHPNGKLLAYEVRHWRYGQESNATAVKLPYSMFGFSATQLTPNTTYVFGVKAETSVGWGPEEIAAVFTSERKVPPPAPPTPLKHSTKQATPSEIWIQWQMRRYDNRELNVDDAPVRWVSLQYQKANDDDWSNYPNWISARKNEAQLGGLSANTAYRFRIRYTGDSLESVWSLESEWIKTLEDAPSKPPSQLQASPYEASSILIQFTAPPQNQWNSDHIGFRILYRTYPSNDTFKTEDIPLPDEMPENGRVEHIIKRLSSFHHYVVQVQTYNNHGNSLPSRPVFVYVGYSIPKQKINQLVSEPLSSTSIRVHWDPWVATEDDVISGYKIRYAPILSSLSPEVEDEAQHGESTEEMVISEKNEITLSDLKKFTEYQISVTGYNRAGEGQSSSVRVQTLEDLPGPVGDLEFHDIMLDSVNLSWTPPVQPNGVIVNYVVRYRTYKLSAGYENSVYQKTSLNYYIATKLEENSTYFFTVQAENSAGKGSEVTSNVSIGYNQGSPEAPSKPSFTPEPSSFVLYWHDGASGTFEISGHVIQAKRIGVAKSSTSAFGSPAVQRRVKREDIVDYHPQHVIGEWVTISSVLGPDTEYRISYRQLEPGSVYVFRVFARNYLGIGRASSESNELIVPESIPDDPFYTSWWFLAIVGCVSFFVVVLFVVFLCCTNSGKRYKNDKRQSFDSLQLADGNIASYELRQSSNKPMRRIQDYPSRPDTHTSWISNDQIRRPDMNAAYGSIASGVDASNSRANSVYRALATDNIPPAPGAYAGAARQFVPNARAPPYASRTNLTDTASIHGNIAEYNTAHRVSDNSFPPTSTATAGSGLPISGSGDNFARHYQVADDEDIYRATWRRTKEQTLQQQQQQQMRSPLPPPPPPAPPVARSIRGSEISNDTSLSDNDGSTSQVTGLPVNVSLRTNYFTPGEHRVSSGSHSTATTTAPNGFSSFV